jgi:hypothetical protein
MAATTTQDGKDTKPNKYLDVKGLNYVPWSMRTKQRMVENDVYKYVMPMAEGGEGVPAHDASEAAVRRYAKGNAAALSEIAKYMQDETLVSLTHHGDVARDMWNGLAAKMVLSGGYDRRIARTELGSYKHKYASDITTTFAELEKLFRTFEMGANPTPLTESEKVGYLASALATAGGRWTTIADEIESELAKEAYNHGVMVITYEAVKTRCDREQRDKTGRRGAWIHDKGPSMFMGRPVGGYNNKNNNNKGRAYVAAYQAALQNGCDEETAEAVACEVTTATENPTNNGGGGGRQRASGWVPRG